MTPMTQKKSLTSFLGRFGALFALVGGAIAVFVIARLLGFL